MSRRIIMAAAVLVGLLLVGVSPAHLQFICGDADGDGDVNIADVTYLVAYMFTGGPVPVPYLAGDCDNDGQVNVADITWLVAYLFYGGPAPCAQPTGSLISHTNCKSFAPDRDSVPPTLDCVFYEWDGGNVLSVQHVNTAFNCCPSALYAQITFNGNIITITESESFDTLGPCACLCLFDLEMQIVNLVPGQYTIVVNQMYLPGDAETHDFTINLTSSPTSGENCLFRDNYPWGDLWLAPLDFGECKDFGRADATDTIPSDQDCLAYSYDGHGVLLMYHINAGFNCCPTAVEVAMDVVGNDIFIEEIEDLDDGGCFCLCLFDLDCGIGGLPPGGYTIHVTEPYLQPGDPPLEFDVVLTSSPSSGIHCEHRTHYPWGF